MSLSIKQSKTDTAIFTIHMVEKPLSEVANFLEMFVSEVKVPESIQSKSVALQVEKKTMNETGDDSEQTNPLLGQIRDRVNGVLTASGMPSPGF
jgi:hypothetical protein